MEQSNHIKRIKKHLERRRKTLLEKASSYKYIDESVSDIAAYNAMKVSRKLDQISFFESEVN